MMSNLLKEEKIVLVVFWITVSFSSIGILLSSVIFILKGAFSTTADINSDLVSSFGSLVGGLFGTVLTLGVAILVLLTYKSQSRELHETVSIAREQSDTLNLQRFESTYFGMLSHLKSIINSMRYTSDGLPQSTLVGPDYLHATLQDFYGQHIKDTDQFAVNWKTDLPSRKDMAKQINNLIMETWENGFFDDKSHFLGHYFRYLYNIIKLVLAERKSEKDRKKYLGILQAQMSNDELCLLFYNLLSRYSFNKTTGKPMFRKIVDKYGLLENINSQYIFNKVLADEYFPKTKFHYL